MRTPQLGWSIAFCRSINSRREPGGGSGAAIRQAFTGRVAPASPVVPLSPLRILLDGRRRPGSKVGARGSAPEAEAAAIMTPTARVIFVLLGTAAYLGLAILGWGGIAAFFSRPPLLALAIVLFALSVAALFAGGNLSSGVREDRGNRWVLAAFGLLGLLAAYLPALTDRRDIWTIDGDAVRWLGVALFAAGGALRLWPVVVLGNRFSGLVAIQPGHSLVTGGIYGVIRHPSYLGLLVNALGWGLAFRSGVGVLLAALMIPPLLARIRAEEALLRTEFGAAYDAYRSHTSRLVPGLY